MKQILYPLFIQHLKITYPDDIARLGQRPPFLNVIQKDHKFTPAENGQVFIGP